MNNLIQGKDAVLSFYKNAFVAVLCSTDISLTLTSDVTPVRTKGDGPWKKVTYQNLSYELTLSGLLKFDVANWTGWDMFDNQINFVQVQFQVTFTDDQNNIRSIRGFAVIKTNTTTINITQLVKQDFLLSGSGSLMIFDGIVPCGTSIDTITVTGQTAADGIAHISYTFTGPVYQVKYRIDGAGNYVYSSAGVTIDVPGLTVGSHSVEIIPVCQNDYEGEGLSQDFQITQALTCATVITAINVDLVNYQITNTVTGVATQMKYRIDGGVWITNAINFTISIASLSVGAHTIEEVPICANNAEGTGLVQPFTIVTQPAQSPIEWHYAESNPGTLAGRFSIYVNGVQVVNEASANNGNITAPNGASVRVVIAVATFGYNPVLTTTDTTTSTVLDTQTAPSPVTLQYTFTTNGDSYRINSLA